MYIKDISGHLYWFFRVPAVLFFYVFLGTSYYWLFLTFIYHYIYSIIYLCLVFVYTFGVLTITTYDSTIVSRFVFLFSYYFRTVYIDLVVMLLWINLSYIILLSFTPKVFFPTGF